MFFYKQEFMGILEGILNKGVFTISFNGQCPPPLIIIRALNKVPEMLKRFENEKKAVIWTKIVVL